MAELILSAFRVTSLSLFLKNKSVDFLKQAEFELKALFSNGFNQMTILGWAILLEYLLD